jgi:hypothetical protein
MLLLFLGPSPVHHPKHLGLNLIYHSMLHLGLDVEEHRVLPSNRFLGIEEILMRDDGRIRDQTQMTACAGEAV